MKAESRLNTAFDLEREWWDKKSQTMIYAKASNRGMIDYIDNLNRFLHEGTGDKTHATKIGTELLSIQASTAEESSPESIQSRLDTLRQRMWRGYGFPTDAVSAAPHGTLIECIADIRMPQS